MNKLTKKTSLLWKKKKKQKYFYRGFLKFYYFNQVFFTEWTSNEPFKGKIKKILFKILNKNRPSFLDEIKVTNLNVKYLIIVKSKPTRNKIS